MNRKIEQINVMENRFDEETVKQCLICGETDPDILEDHHIFGRNNSDLVTTLCKNCHTKVTAEQNKLPREFRSKNASFLGKIAYQLISIGALLREIGRQMIRIGHEVRYYE